LATGLILGGCAQTKQARSVEESGYLGSDIYQKLQDGKEGQALKVYRNEQVDIASYRNVIIDNVYIQKPDNASPEDIALLQTLANNFHAYLTQELKKQYTVVPVPDPSTIRFQAGLFNPEKKNVVMNTISSIVPIGAAVSVIKDASVGKPLNTGAISVEMKITDATTGQLIAAAVDKRVGQKYSGDFKSWGDADAAMEYWAKLIGYRACQAKKGANCVMP
jgi:hypothetical protein